MDHRRGMRVDFATLTPANGLAARWFEALRDRLATQPQQLHHHRQFVKFDEPSTTLPRSLSPNFKSPISLSSNATTEEDLPSDEDVPVDVTGSYVLAFISTAPPVQVKSGWVIGTGYFDRNEITGCVDLLLSPPKSDNDLTHVRPDFPYQRHVAFKFDSLGRLSIFARHKRVFVDGNPLQPSSSRILTSHARIEIGPLHFIFHFTVPELEQTSYREALRDYLSKFHGGVTPPEITSATPSQNDVRIGDRSEWHVHGIVGTTVSSVIQAASNIRTGEAVAVKRLLRTRTSAKAVDKELGIYDSLLNAFGQHEYSKFVMQKHSVVFGRASDDNAQEVYLLWKPLARMDFGRFRYSDLFQLVPKDVKLQLFCQALLGLKSLHDIGWIHRDLKPQNMAVVSFDPPYAILIDFGMAVKVREPGHLPDPGSCGTIGCLAPELENSVFALHYGQKVDVWSMGAVGMFMIDLGRFPWSTTRNMFLPESAGVAPNFNAFQDYISQLQQAPSATFQHLLFHMLQLKPRDRLDVQEALAHPTLQDAFAATSKWLITRDESSKKRRHE